MNQVPTTYKRTGLFRVVGYGFVGIGYDEEMAYRDWWRQVRADWIAREAAALERLQTPRQFISREQAEISRQMEEQL